MAESSEQSEENPSIIKSINNDIGVNVRFSNRSGRTASLLWYNFEGVFVKYGILHDKDIMDMCTYVTHPWGARDATTGDVLNIGGQPVYYPQVPGDGVKDVQFPLISIDLPLYSLKEICLQQVQKLYPKKNISTIADVLPWSLLTELKEGGKHEVHYLYKNIKVSKGSHVEHTFDADGLVEVVKLDGQNIPMGDHQLESDSKEEETMTNTDKQQANCCETTPCDEDSPQFPRNKTEASSSCCCS